MVRRAWKLRMARQPSFRHGRKSSPRDQPDWGSLSRKPSMHQSGDPKVGFRATNQLT